MSDLHVPQADILIVDDIPENLRLLSAILTERGYDVRCVTNGNTALMGIGSQPPDLILLDIQMPGLDGYEVCTRLKSNRDTRSIPIVFISGLTEVFDKIKAFSVGGADYITKPFQVEEVLARVETQLAIYRLQSQLQTSLDRERQLNQQIEAMATLEERNRIARDIHDSLGHALVALNIQMEAALALWDDRPERAHAALVEAKQLGTQALQAVRESVTDMRSTPLHGKLLVEAIEALVGEFSRTTGIVPQLQLSLTRSTSPAVNTAAYRIVQEGLTNICKYARATVVSIQLASTPTGLQLVLQDNGRGFDAAAARTGFGLQGMAERVAAVGGQLQIESAPGSGCRLSAILPQLD
jgi:two-component system, sensor histidine kinase and response regulator